jgi:hypothetical protein
MIQLPELLIVLGILVLVGTFLSILHHMLASADEPEA